jgi:hypothetical protein
LRYIMRTYSSYVRVKAFDEVELGKRLISYKKNDYEEINRGKLFNDAAGCYEYWVVLKRKI